MAHSAKDIRIEPITVQSARRIIERYHYSESTVRNSNIHLGVFLAGKCLGAMQFGPPLDKKKLLPLVSDTKWNGMLELNRMAFADALPRNSESRALAIAFRLLRKTYPHIEWVVSFSDATQCGDGTIYRAAGFVLTQIKRNDRMFNVPGYGVQHAINFELAKPSTVQAKLRQQLGMPFDSANALLKAIGATPLVGYQLRYVYFLHEAARHRLQVPIIPFDEIAKRGVTMYRGQRARSTDSGAAGFQPEGGGAIPTRALDNQPSNSRYDNKEAKPDSR